MDPSQLPLAALIGIFLVCAVILTLCGVRITDVGTALSERTGLGQAVFGAAFIGGATSLSGIVVSANAAATGHPEMALGNAVGGIAAQTVFLAIADLTHRPANLEHAAASTPNMLQAALLMTLLSLPLLALGAPELEFFGVSPVSLAIIAGYVFGLKLSSSAREDDPWKPKETPETVAEEEGGEGLPESLTQGPMWKVWAQFGVLALVLGGCGYVVSETAVELSARFELSESVLGTYLTAITTSLPELVTALAAVHRGALALAVGDILGGNAFDSLMVAFSDVAYRDGSIFTALGDPTLVTIGMAQVLTGLVLMGLIRRERHGIANIGFESVLSLVLYVLGAAFLMQ